MQKTILSRHGSMTHYVYSGRPDDIMSDFVVETVEDVAPILRDVVRAKELPQSKDMRLAAKVPMAVVEQAMREGWFNDNARWRAWLNDPDNRKFRVAEGRV